MDDHDEAEAVKADLKYNEDKKTVHEREEAIAFKLQLQSNPPYEEKHDRNPY